ncbi:MAG: MGDG synthase family glycosyltransferase [Streptosporangiales bacterium]
MTGSGPRILVVSGEMGAGHNAAGRAVVEAARQRWPGCEDVWVDTLDVMGPGVGPTFRGFYVGNVRYTPRLYQFYFEANWRVRWFAQSSKWVVGAWSGPPLERVIRRTRPDLIISTYPLGSAGLDWLRRRGRLNVPVQVWVCDFAPHPFWVYHHLQHHFVMHEVAEPAVRAVAPDARVRVVAPPVDARFTPGDTTTARAAVGLDPEGFVAFVSCGSFGFGTVESAVRTLLDADERVRVIAATGRNEVLGERLRALPEAGGRLSAPGWLDDIPEWLRASDVVVTNAGGATALEALATNTPVLMFQPIAAHGRANAEYMADAGLADICDTTDELASTVRELATDAAALSSRREAMAKHCAGRSLVDDVAALPPRGWE